MKNIAIIIYGKYIAIYNSIIIIDLKRNVYNLNFEGI